jgi:hypothetical protein
MLDLQCHFGMDTLSWARLGARVTGTDFSEDPLHWLFDDDGGKLNITGSLFQRGPFETLSVATYADSRALPPQSRTQLDLDGW